MTGRLEGKVAFVTGAARGQGRSHATRLAEEGADVIAVDVCADIPTAGYPGPTRDDLDETVRQVEALDRRVLATQADVRDADALRAAVDAGVAELGRLDVVVANAGIAGTGPVDQLSEQAWQTMVDINLTGVWHTAKVTVPHLEAGASVVLVSSIAGIKGLAYNAHYAAAKHGVIGLMRSMVNELAPRMIRVNTVLPTNVETDMLLNESIYRLFLPEEESPTREQVEPLFAGINAMPLPYVQPRDVSNAVVFLASDESRYVTGALLPVDLGAITK